MSDAHGVARDQLRAFVARIERLEEEKKTIADDIKDVYGEAKSMGFDTKVLKKIVALRKKDENERAEEEALLDVYKAALGMIPQLDMFDKETGEVFDTRSPRKAAEAVSERTAIQSLDNVPCDAVAERPALVGPQMGMAEDTIEGQPSVTVSLTVQHGGVNVGGPERAGVTAGETAPNSPIAPASHGEAEAPSAERVSPAEGGSAAANTGGDHVDPDHSHAATAGTRINHIVPATPPKTARDFRPHCLKPDACGASGLDHCYSCKRAMKAQEEFA